MEFWAGKADGGSTLFSRSRCADRAAARKRIVRLCGCPHGSNRISPTEEAGCSILNSPVVSEKCVGENQARQLVCFLGGVASCVLADGSHSR
jgi:hypothetical protein